MGLMGFLLALLVVGAVLLARWLSGVLARAARKALDDLRDAEMRDGS